MRDLIWLTTNTSSDNDAVFMARAFGLTPWFWCSLWAVGAAAILAILPALLRAKYRQRPGERRFHRLTVNQGCF